MTSSQGKESGVHDDVSIGVGPGVDRGGQAFSRRFVTPLLLGSTLNPINTSLIATALAPIAHALNVPVGRTAILVSGLYLASSIAQPTAGKLAEPFGPRRVLIVGIMVVLVGGIVGGVGQDIPTVAVARVMIGIGTSTGYPTAMVIIRRRAAWAGLSEPPGRLLGGLSIASTVTIAVGPPIGGVLVDAFGWRSTFLVNIPITVVALLLTMTCVPKDEPLKRRPLREITSRIDVSGILLFGGTMSAVLVFLLSLPSPHWIALGVAVVLCVVLVVWELRAATPFIDMRLLVSNPGLTRTYVRCAYTLLCSYTVLYGLSQWLEAARGLSPQQAGLMLLPMGIVAAFVSQPISARNLVRGPLVIGAASLVLASVSVALFTTQTALAALVGVTLLFAITLGTTTVGNQTALYVHAPAEHVGTAAGLFRTFGYAGAIASSTLTGIVFRHNVTDSGMHLVGGILVGVSIVVLAMTVLDRTLKAPTAAPPRTMPNGGRGFVDPEGRSAMTRVVKRGWIPMVMVIVVAVAAFTVARLHGVFGSHMYAPDAGNADAIIQFNPKHVLFDVFGAPGTVADINYLDEQGQPQRLDAVRLPWSFEIVTTLTAVLASVVAQGNSDNIGCRITVNGVVRDEQSADSYKAQTSCLVKSA
jgi:MFS family permease